MENTFGAVNKFTVDKKLDKNLFYSIEVKKNIFTLQGYMNRDILNTLTKEEIEFDLDKSNNMITSESVYVFDGIEHRVRIILT